MALANGWHRSGWARAHDRLAREGFEPAKRGLAGSVPGRGAERVREVVAGVDYQLGQQLGAAGSLDADSWQS